MRGERGRATRAGDASSPPPRHSSSSPRQGARDRARRGSFAQPLEALPATRTVAYSATTTVRVRRSKQCSPQTSSAAAKQARMTPKRSRGRVAARRSNLIAQILSALAVEGTMGCRDIGLTRGWRKLSESPQASDNGVLADRRRRTARDGRAYLRRHADPPQTPRFHRKRANNLAHRDDPLALPNAKIIDARRIRSLLRSASSTLRTRKLHYTSARSAATTADYGGVMGITTGQPWRIHRVFSSAWSTTPRPRAELLDSAA